MKKYINKSVYDAAKERIEILAELFDGNIYFAFSGGKDSTVLINLAREVLGSVNVFFMDLQFITLDTVALVEYYQQQQWCKLTWFVPIGGYIPSDNDNYSKLWVDNYYRTLPANYVELPTKKNDLDANRVFKISLTLLTDTRPVCSLGGVCADESLNRYAAFRYRDFHYLFQDKKEFYHAYPIYDWSIQDIWKYIKSNNCAYSEIYNRMTTFGIKAHEQRVCNLTSVYAKTKKQKMLPFFESNYTYLNDILGINNKGAVTPITERATKFAVKTYSKAWLPR
ncbi:MAG: phosphoadenosine phosphosulfate reductase family protein [Saprospiraceae bacterium]